MKHKPFETLIFSDEPLSLQEDEFLQVHLRNCDKCIQLDTGWRQIHSFLKSVQAETPEDGFVGRFQKRMAIQHTRQQRRQSLALFMLSSGGAAIVFVLFSSLFLTHLQSVTTLLNGLLERVFDWFVFFNVAKSIFIDILITLPAAIPSQAWMGVFALIGVAGVIWLKAFRKLAYYQGFPQWA